MPNEKPQINLIIKDFDNVIKVLGSLEHIHRAIVDYYLDNEKLKDLDTYVIAHSVYFGKLLRLLGYREGDFKDKDEN